MPPQLVALSEGPNLLLDKPIMLIGRHQECDIQIPSRKISRRHCCIAQVNDHIVIRDLFSTNGIRINGVRVAEGNLNGGDELTIGNYRYEVRMSASPAAHAGAPGHAAMAQPAQAPPLPPRAEPAVPVALPALGLPDLNAFDSCEEPIPLAEPEAPPLQMLEEIMPIPTNSPTLSKEERDKREGRP